MAIDIKFTKFDNTPWGFRLAGGSDFPQPLTVIRITEGSLAECMGLQVGDVVVRLNDQPVSSLTHGKAHEQILLAGNNFVLGVLRGEESRKAIEAIPQENIVPYTIPLEELPPVYPEEVRQDTPEVEEEVTSTVEYSSETLEYHRVETIEKPIYPDSEEVPNKNLTDDEIALLILEEEELLPDQGVLGVNFKKLRPRAQLLKESKVFEELQNIATAEPPQVQELKRTTTFLQKPQRPVPKAKEEKETEVVEPYKVVIKKQQKKSITERLLEKGLLEPGSIKTPESRSEKTTPSATPEPTEEKSDFGTESRPESKLEEIVEVAETDSAELAEPAEDQLEPTVEEPQEEEPVDRIMEEVQAVSKLNKEKIKELVSTEISLEKQLENVQSQLLALKQLPSEIENHLKIVSEQLHKIMELSGVQSESRDSSRRGSEQQQQQRESREQREEQDRYEEDQRDEIRDDCSREFETEAQDNQGEVQEVTDGERESVEGEGSQVTKGELPQVIEEQEETVTSEVEIKVKGKGENVKKFIVSYESQVLRSRGPSPACSERSFEPDPNLAPKDQVIQELQQRHGRKHSKDLWPQAKQLELTYGRRWRCPNDFFNDDMIAEVLSSQAEVLRGKALGINFKKYEKTNLPNYDHLINSSVYKMIHKMEREPKKGIPVRPSKVNAAEDILERVRSPALSVTDERSNRSISH
ncbi:glutamic acid-rich protein isoform X3 [Cephus cinctus]|uniref:Glutamic acid-rich protein isoform X3 n=1 Tax=Cephus cinctus TaxID=211228 RepID=A0AAJ7FH77_CEPCN|nr:glutamic acid-rich protein isoform X3 [Cephus cinctus]